MKALNDVVKRIPVNSSMTIHISNGIATIKILDPAQSEQIQVFSATRISGKDIERALDIAVGLDLSDD